MLSLILLGFAALTLCAICKAGREIRATREGFGEIERRQERLSEDVRELRDEAEKLRQDVGRLVSAASRRRR